MVMDVARKLFIFIYATPRFSFDLEAIYGNVHFNEVRRHSVNEPTVVACCQVVQKNITVSMFRVIAKCHRRIINCSMVEVSQNEI